jgi:SAM-dependent methyltransferase
VGTSRHWDEVYRSKPVDTVSWHQDKPAVSLRLVTSAGSPCSAVVDVGAGAATLADELLAAGWTDLTVLDVSAEALALVRERLDDAVQTVTTDVLSWTPERRYDVWHDRAVLHFLVDPEQQRRYVDVAAAAVPAGGALVIGVFAPDGPTQCSGLPTERYDAQRLERLFAPRFALVHSESEIHTTPAGAPQSFTWAVLRRR